jgi:hypothetical protein
MNSYDNKLYLILSGEEYKMRKKIIGIFAILLFFGVSVLPNVCGNVVNINAIDINTNNSTQGDTNSTDYKHVVYFIVGTIKDKQKIEDNFYGFIVVKGLFILIAGFVYIIPCNNEPVAVIYDFKIGYFGNNFACVAFFLPLPGS